jgi:hypothetical protein
MVHVSFFKPQNTHQDGIAKKRSQINRFLETILLLPHPIFSTEAPWRLQLGCRACICRPLLMLLINVFRYCKRTLWNPLPNRFAIGIPETKKPPVGRSESNCPVDLMVSLAGWLWHLVEQVAGRSQGQVPRASLHDYFDFINIIISNFGLKVKLPDVYFSGLFTAFAFIYSVPHLFDRSGHGHKIYFF